MNLLAHGIVDRFLSATRRLWQRPMILFFHGVDTVIDDPRVQTLHMDRGRFVRFMHSLRRHHRVIGIDELADCLESGSQPPMDAVVLTFDDGYLNNLTEVAPIMQLLGLPPFCLSQWQVERHLPCRPCGAAPGGFSHGNDHRSRLHQSFQRTSFAAAVLFRND